MSVKVAKAIKMLKDQRFTEQERGLLVEELLKDEGRDRDDVRQTLSDLHSRRLERQTEEALEDRQDEDEDETPDPAQNRTEKRERRR